MPSRRRFLPPRPGSRTLDLLISSEADVFSGGSASNFSQVGFQATAVPEPQTWMLVLAAPVLLGVPLRQRR